MTMIYTGSTISFQHANKFHQAHASHPSFETIVNLCKTGDYAQAANLIDIKAVVTQALKGSDAELIGSNVYYKGEVVNSLLARRILTLTKEGFDASPLLLFLENLMSNPSKRAVDELYGFLEVSKLPITDDGHFLAYKSVRYDYRDHHSGTMDNSVGSVVSMERNKVDEDKDRTCSYGLHFAAHEYAQGFGGGKMVVLKINPRDVVAIPSDYDNQKGRCARYEVIEEVERSDTKLVDKAFVDTGTTKGTPKVLRPDDVEVGKNYMFSGWVFSDLLPQPFLATVLSNDVSEVLLDPVGINGTQIYHKGHDSVTVTPPPTYVPQESNYEDPIIWDVDENGCLLFIGEIKEFPVNRDTPYVLTRLSDSKEYRGKFFFTSYDKQNDNLVFKREATKYNKERYVTISDVNNWYIEYLA